MFNSHRFSLISVSMRAIVILFVMILSGIIQPETTVHSAPGLTFTVNDNGDAPDLDIADYVCDTNPVDGEQCTLRAAITQANFMDTHDTIDFQGDVVLIAPETELPPLTDDAGATVRSDHLIYLLATFVPGANGLTLESSNNKVMGLVIAGFANGVIVEGHNNVIGTDGDGVDDSSEMNIIYANDNGSGTGVELVGNNNVVAGNTIGLTITGNAAGPNITGILVSGNNNRIGTDGDGISDTVERNVISGNSQFGIDISGDDTIVAGNTIGLNADGDAAISNGSNGIDIDPLAARTRVGTDGDGTGDVEERNIISGNGQDGVKSKGDYVTIAGNYIGTDAAGTSAIPNGEYGVSIGIGSYETVVGTDSDGAYDYVEGNIISGNTSGGVEITGNIHDTVIAGNKIGTNPAGTTAIANQGDGIYAQGIGDELVIGTNGDGVADVNERNIISGNTQDGVHLSTDLANAVVAGNHIGTNTAGTAALGNGANGVHLDGGTHQNLIGTNADGIADSIERNLISGNGESGVKIEGVGSDHNHVTGNYIGTNVSGNSALGNSVGVRIDDHADETLVGADTKPDLGNVISGNTNDGIHIGTNCDSTSINYNVIGLNYLQLIAVSNGQHGIYLTDGAFDTRVEYNSIARNGGDGIYMSATAGSGNLYYINRIYGNGGLGVDLAPDGVNINDPGDADSGPNDLMNYPEFIRLVTDGTETLIEGVINSEPDKKIQIDLYAVENCDPSGYGEGGGEGAETETLSTQVETDSSGTIAFSIWLGVYSEDRPYMVMSTGYSEFSECKLIEPDQDPEAAMLSIADSSLMEGNSGSVFMDFDITLDRTAVITVSVDYITHQGSAVRGEDYNPDYGTVTFLPGITTQGVSVEILGDVVVEPDETFTVEIRDPIGARLNDALATGLILNDDVISSEFELFLPNING